MCMRVGGGGGGDNELQMVIFTPSYQNEYNLMTDRTSINVQYGKRENTVDFFTSNIEQA